MDNCTITDSREENIHGSDNGSCCGLLWTVTPLPGQVSVLIESFIVIETTHLLEQQVYIPTSVSRTLQSFTHRRISDLHGYNLLSVNIILTTFYLPMILFYDQLIRNSAEYYRCIYYFNKNYITVTHECSRLKRHALLKCFTGLY